jgi:hypothetical protein
MTKHDRICMQVCFKSAIFKKPVNVSLCVINQAGSQSASAVAFLNNLHIKGKKNLSYSFPLCTNKITKEGATLGCLKIYSLYISGV